jgi:hypothetical protein
MSTNDPLQTLLDIEAIRTLVALYAQYIAQGEGELVSLLFSVDGAYRTRKGAMGETDIEGRKAIGANLSHLSPGTAVPLVTNVIVKIEGDRATGSSTLYSPRSPVARGGSPTQPFYGVYADRYGRFDREWRFVERVFTYFPPLK